MLSFAFTFDCISQSKLIHKLFSYGIQGNLLFWIEAFLYNRTQRVKINYSLENTGSSENAFGLLGPVVRAELILYC